MDGHNPGPALARRAVAADLLTLSRAATAVWLLAAALTGRGLRAAWAGLVLGCTVTDWLDGPLARRGGLSRYGAALDVEADSMLTLAAAYTAHRRGRLGAWVLIAPLLRYPLATRRLDRPSCWRRAAGVAQMIALCAALSPWLRARAAGRAMAPYAAAAQLLALLSEASSGAAAAKGPG